MLLHGVPGADIQLEDTLLHPIHREAGELERFDHVIANPPFNQNPVRGSMEFPERFHWDWVSDGSLQRVGAIHSLVMGVD
jgi:type I restriction enzyme M protein